MFVLVQLTQFLYVIDEFCMYFLFVVYMIGLGMIYILFHCCSGSIPLSYHIEAYLIIYFNGLMNNARKVSQKKVLLHKLFVFSVLFETYISDFGPSFYSDRGCLA